MNKKNITYCTLAILTIAVVAVTANQSSKSSSSIIKSEMAFKSFEQKEELQSKKDLSNNNIKVSANQDLALIKENKVKKNKIVFTESEKYTKTDLHRALMYQKKSWAKDDTINDDAWKASKKLDKPDLASEKKPSKKVEKEPDTSVRSIKTTNVQDSKDNNAMAD